MQFDGNCIECLVKRQWELARRHGDGEKANDYLREVLQIILDAPAGVAAPWLSGAFVEAYQKYWPGEDAYAQLKKDSNDLVLSLLPEVRAQVAASENPLKLALQFARTGNFLDFGVLTPETAHRALQDALQHTEESPLDGRERNRYNNIRRLKICFWKKLNFQSLLENRFYDPVCWSGSVGRAADS